MGRRGLLGSRLAAYQPVPPPTVCDEAKESCPTIPGVAEQAHWSIEDPSAVEGDEKARLDAFRETRDIIRDRVHIFVLAAGRDDLPQPEPRTVGGGIG